MVDVVDGVEHDDGPCPTCHPELYGERKGVPSASGVERLALCPGSWNLERTLPPGPESPDAASGTRIHAALAGEMELETLADDEHETYEKCRAIAQETVASWKAEGELDEVFTEERLWLGEEFSGKSDVIYVQGERALLLDWKTGRNEVTSAEGNAQLRSLAVLAYENITDLKEIVVGVIQPWASPQVSLCRYTEDDILIAADELSHILLRAKEPDAPRVPSEKQCRFCRARSSCPEAKAAALAIATVAPASVAELSATTLSDFLERAKLAENIIEACRDEAKRRLAEDPASIPGWSLKPGAQVEKITDPERVFIKAEANGVSVPEFLSCVSVEKGKLKEAVGKATRTKGKQLDAVLEQILAGCTEMKQNAPSLERVKD